MPRTLTLDEVYGPQADPGDLSMQASPAAQPPQVPQAQQKPRRALSLQDAYAPQQPKPRRTLSVADAYGQAPQAAASARPATPQGPRQPTLAESLVDISPYTQSLGLPANQATVEALVHQAQREQQISADYAQKAYEAYQSGNKEEGDRLKGLSLEAKSRTTGANMAPEFQKSFNEEIAKQGRLRQFGGSLISGVSGTAELLGRAAGGDTSDFQAYRQALSEAHPAQSVTGETIGSFGDPALRLGGPALRPLEKLLGPTAERAAQYIERSRASNIRVPYTPNIPVIRPAVTSAVHGAAAFGTQEAAQRGLEAYAEDKTPSEIAAETLKGLGEGSLKGLVLGPVFHAAFAAAKSGLDKLPEVASEKLARRELGLPLFGDLSSEQINKAFKQAAFQAHPDRGGTEEDFGRVTAAAERLRSKQPQGWPKPVFTQSPKQLTGPLDIDHMTDAEVMAEAKATGVTPNNRAEAVGAIKAARAILASQTKETTNAQGPRGQAEEGSGEQAVEQGAQERLRVRDAEANRAKVQPGEEGRSVAAPRRFSRIQLARDLAPLARQYAKPTDEGTDVDTIADELDRPLAIHPDEYGDMSKADKAKIKRAGISVNEEGANEWRNTVGDKKYEALVRERMMGDKGVIDQLTDDVLTDPTRHDPELVLKSYLWRRHQGLAPEHRGVKQVDVDPKELPAGTTVEILGDEFTVHHTDSGEIRLQDGIDIHNADQLETLPVDEGTVKLPEMAEPEGEFVPPEEQGTILPVAQEQGAGRTPTPPEPQRPGGQAIASLADAFDRYDNTGDITGSELADHVDALIAEGKAPESLQTHVDAYRDEVREDLEKYGQRSGEPELAEKKLADAVREAVQPQEEIPVSVKKPEPFAIDLSPIQEAKAVDDVHAEGGKLLTQTNEPEHLKAIQQAMRKRAGELEKPAPSARPDTGEGAQPGQQLGLLGEATRGGITGKQASIPFEEPSKLTKETENRPVTKDVEGQQTFGEAEKKPEPVPAEVPYNRVAIGEVFGNETLGYRRKAAKDVRRKADAQTLADSIGGAIAIGRHPKLWDVWSKAAKTREEAASFPIEAPQAQAPGIRVESGGKTYEYRGGDWEHVPPPKPATTEPIRSGGYTQEDASDLIQDLANRNEVHFNGHDLELEDMGRGWAVRHGRPDGSHESIAGRGFTRDQAISEAANRIRSVLPQQAKPTERPNTERDYGTPDNPDTKALSDHFTQAFERGDSFPSIVDARKRAEQLLGGPVPREQIKKIDEAVEVGIVRNARNIAELNWTPSEKFDALVKLLNQQPNLSTRTSTSVEQQAYSTPAPIAFLGSELARIGDRTTVYEPTAGNGMLLINAEPRLTVANEINPDRAAALKAQGFYVTEFDASDVVPNRKFSVVYANPPFGRVRDEQGEVEVFSTGQFRTPEIDHAIAMKALSAMQDNGRAVLILGSKGNEGQANREQAYRSGKNNDFYHFLYQDYNVTDHFTISGDLYRKQGAGFPIDMVVVEGRGKSALATPMVKAPRVYSTWEDLKGRLNELAPQRTAEGVEPAGAGLRDTIGGAASPEQAGVEPRPVPRPVVDESRVADRERGGQAQRVEPSERRLGTGGVSGPTERGPRGGADTGGGAEAAPAGPRPGRGVPGEAQPKPGRAGGGAGNQPERVAKPPAAQRARPDVAETEFQVGYEPGASSIESVGTLVPRNMKDAISDALKDIATQAGTSIEDHVADELQDPQLADHYSAEQVDALAMAIANVRAGAGFIIGDQTGVGKGRFVAGMLRYAELNNMVPVFITEKPNLYADIIRDITDIGMNRPEDRYNILPTNKLRGEDALDLPDGRKLETPTNNEDVLKEALANFRAGNGLTATVGRGRKAQAVKFNAIATTYSQMQSVGGKDTWRQDFLRELAPHAMIIMDESHNAGGTEQRKATGAATGRAELAREMVGNARAVIYSSATYAKRPSVMDLYAATDMHLAVDNPAALGEAIRKGGIPMQQAVANMLAQAKQYIRRERSFQGVEFKAATVKADHAFADKMSEIFRGIDAFDGVKAEAIEEIQDNLAKEGKKMGLDTSTGKGGVHSTNFTALMHNVVDQMLLATKVDSAVGDIRSALERGEKPVIALSNTMEGLLDRVMHEEGAKLGDVSGASFRDVMQRYLERSREIIIKPPGAEKGESYRHRLTDAELGPAGVQAFDAAQDLIAKAPLDSVPASPIDYLIAKLEAIRYTPPGGKERAVKVGEITGRQLRLDYSGHQPIYAERPDHEVRPSGRVKSIKSFQSGDMDIIIINQAGSTGISLHSDKARAKDLRRRHMFILQADKNIDTFMQTIGRVHRTGQVIEPKYSLVMTDLPTELRPASALTKKLSGLNASVTADSRSAVSFDVPDVMNVVGDAVAFEALEADPELQATLGLDPDDFKEPASENAGAIAAKITGRVAMLPVAEQEAFWKHLGDAFDSRLNELRAMGENPLRAENLDLDAKTISSSEIKAAKTGVKPSPFTEAANLELVDAKSTSKPFKSDEIASQIAEQVGAEKGTPAHRLQEMGQEKARQLIGQTRKEFDKYLAERKPAPDTMQRMRDDFQDLSTMAGYYFTPGKAVTITRQEDAAELNGVVTKLERRGTTKNPAAASSWYATVALPKAEAGRQLTVPLSGFIGNSPRFGVSDWRHGDAIGEFDRGQTQNREQRYIATGNLLAASEQVGGQGQIVHYTTSEGQTRTGILLPKKFKVEDMLGNRPIYLSKGANALKLMEAGHMVASSDQALQAYIDHRDGKIVFTAPKSKARGGIYYLHKYALDAAGNAEYVSSGNNMVMRVPKATAARVIDGYIKTDIKFVPMGGDQARDVAADIEGIKTDEQIKDEMRAKAGGGVEKSVESSGGEHDETQQRGLGQGPANAGHAAQAGQPPGNRFGRGGGSPLSGTSLVSHRPADARSIEDYHASHGASIVRSGDGWHAEWAPGGLSYDLSYGTPERLSADIANDRDVHSYLNSEHGKTIAGYVVPKTVREFRRLPQEAQRAIFADATAKGLYDPSKSGILLNEQKAKVRHLTHEITHAAVKQLLTPEQYVDAIKPFLLEGEDWERGEERLVHFIAKDTPTSHLPPEAAKVIDGLRSGEMLKQKRPERSAQSHRGDIVRHFQGKEMSVERGLADPFYSELTRAAERFPKPDAKMSPEQFRGWLKKQPGIKADEVKWTGLDDFLAGKEKVTAQEVAEYLRNNEVRVEEVVKQDDKRLADIVTNQVNDRTWYVRSESMPDSDRGYKIEYMPTNGLYKIDNVSGMGGPFSSLEEAVHQAGEFLTNRRATEPKKETRYGSYSLLGGENYRELLLTLPTRVQTVPTGPRGWLDPHNPNAASGDVNFRSSHWSESNVLAHVRFDERTTADGQRTLHIAEVQSDWAAQAREKGISETEIALGFLVEQKADASGRLRWVVEDGDGTRQVWGNSRADAVQAHANLYGRAGAKAGVPDAPYIRSTEAYATLAMRRMIRWAAEHGFDQISWDTGATNAERYDLSKHLDRIEYDPVIDDNGEPTGWYDFTAYAKDGSIVFYKEEIPLSKVEELAGKEIATKIKAGEGESMERERPNRPGWRAIKGLDLKVGGHGMAGFYDSILPSVANKIGKKWGARVGEGQVDVSGEVRQQDAILQPLGKKKPKMEAVHALPITPAMRESVLYEGQPMFSVEAGGGGAGKPPETADGAAGGDEPVRGGSGVKDLAGRFVGVPRKVAEAIHDAFDLEGVPKLRRLNLETAQAAVNHATAPDYINPLVNHLIGQVTPRYNEPEFLAKFGRFLNENNRLGIYDQIKDNAAKYGKKADALSERAKATEDPDKSRKIANRAEAVKRLADAADRNAKAIEKKFDLDKLDDEVAALYADKDIKAASDKWEQVVNPEMDRLYNAMKGLEPDFEQPSRGRYGQARVNLKPAPEGEATGPRQGTGGLRNPSIKRDPFARSATGLGTYDTDPYEILRNSFGRRLNESTKIDFIRKLVRSGGGVLMETDAGMPETLGGEPVKKLVVDRWPISTVNEAGDAKVRLVTRNLFVPQSLEREVRDVLNTDMRAPNNPLTRFLTHVQLLQLVDATSHLANQATLMLNTPGGKTLQAELGRKLGLNLHTLFTEYGKTLVDIARDTPEIRAKVARLYAVGAGRSEAPAGSKANPFTWTNQLLHASDTAVRLSLMDRYDNLVSRGLMEDTPQSRRDFVNQLGNYNRRLMSWTMRTLRDYGASPFIVAGRTFNRNARRILTGKVSGQAPTGKAAAINRLTQIFGAAVAVAALPALINYLTTGKMGGRPGTPFGAIDTGKNEKNGRPTIIDPPKWIGLRRGMRVTGAGAVAKGIQQSQSPSHILGDALHDIVDSAVHPWTGPAVSTTITALTGSDLSGRQIAPTEANPLAQIKSNVGTALEQANPTAAALFNNATEQPQSQDKTVTETGVTGPLKRLVGVGPGYRPQTEAQRTMDEILRSGYHTTPTAESKAAHDIRREVERGGNAVVLTGKAVREGKISRDQANDIIKDSRVDPRIHRFKELSFDEAKQVYDLGNSEEKRIWKPWLLKKRLNWLKEHPGQKAELPKAG